MHVYLDVLIEPPANIFAGCMSATVRNVQFTTSILDGFTAEALKEMGICRAEIVEPVLMPDQALTGRHVAAQQGDVWVWLAETRQMSETEVAEALAAARNCAAQQIDAAAEAVRQRYLTPGAGQAMVYGQKVAEAKDHQAGGTGPWPHLEAEVGITGPTIEDVATIILNTEAAWLAVSAVIEAARLSGKKAVGQAGDLAGIATAESAALAALAGE